ncbi:MAG: ATP-binding cassette domain-containing protein [Pseudomonadota bacterium]
MLEARHVSVELSGTIILRDVSAVFRPGLVTAIIGPNGAGKSTLLACLSGALRPASGDIAMEGDDPHRLSPAILGMRRAVLEQNPASAVAFTLEELLDLGIPREVPPAESAGIVQRAKAALGLARLAGRPIDRLSGGEQHRAHMARALAQLWAGQHLGGGQWLMLDEPTASLDLAHQAAVVRAARGAAAEGAGVLAVLHDLTLAAAIADRVVVMNAGAIAANGTPAEVLSSEVLSPVYGIDLVTLETGRGGLAVVPDFA